MSPLLQAAISINGLNITTDGLNGSASAPIPASGSFSAFLVPEPSVLSLLSLAGLTLLWRRQR
jgi:hypothetical protein